MTNFIMIDRRVAVSASNKRLLRMVALLLIAILVLTGCNRKAMQLGMRKATQENIDANVASTSGQLDNLEVQDKATQGHENIDTNVASISDQLANLEVQDKATQGHENIDTNVASISDQLANLEVQDKAEGKNLLEILEKERCFNIVDFGDNLHAILSALKGTPVLTTITRDENNISDEGARALAKALENNNTVTQATTQAALEKRIAEWMESANSK